MNRNLLHGLVAALALLSSTACSSKPTSDDASASAKASTAAEHKLAELTVDEVEARIAKNDGKTFVYDDNHDEVYASGHVPGAKHLDSDNIPASAFPADKDATLIFYCANTH
jgi:Rhodanese-like domain